MSEDPIIILNPHPGAVVVMHTVNGQFVAKTFDSSEQAQSYLASHPSE